MQAANLQEEPLSGHMVYEKVVALSKPPGAFKQVARNRQTGELVCIKFVPRGWDQKTAVAHTRSLYNHMEVSLSNHPHIVEMKGAFLTPYYLALVMEYVEGETVEHFLEKVGGKVIEGLARFIMQQLIIAVDFCHKRGKLLRDIKLSNILLAISEGQLPLLKLCDFSISKDMLRDLDDQSQPETSALFAAPEMAMGGSYDGKAADLWSCGIVLYVMLFGRHPFMRESDAELEPTQRLVMMMQRMMRSDIDFPMASLEPLSSGCVQLISLLLVANPNQRMKMHNMATHPWFTEALPEGAGQMNDLFIADSVKLSIEQVAFFKALIKKASIDDGDVNLTPPVVHQQPPVAQQQQPPLIKHQTPVYKPGRHQQHQMYGTNISGTSTQTTQQPLGAMYSDPRFTQQRTSDATACFTPNHTQPPQPQPRYMMGGSGDGFNDGIEEGGFLDLLSAPSFMAVGGQQQRMPSFLQPTFLQQQLAETTGSPDQQRWLADLEDAVMSIPSQELLAAATVDIREQATGERAQRLESSAMSLIAPRTMSELERSLCTSSSFMREAQAAGMTGDFSSDLAPSRVLHGGGIGGMSRFGRLSAGQAMAAATAADGNDPQQFLVDPAPFLFDADKDMPHANVSAMMTSFDWDSFNGAFTSEAVEAEMLKPATEPTVTPAAATAKGSAWARVCREVGVRLSKGNLGDHPNG